MAIVNENKSQHTVTAGKVLATTALCCTPIISEPGDLLMSTIKNRRIDKTPIKDCFIKSLIQSGEGAQALFSSLKKFSPLKLGITTAVLWTILDVSLTYWFVDKIAEKLKKK